MWMAARCVGCSPRWRVDDRAAVRRPRLPGLRLTDMRKGMQGLAMLVQQVLAEDPFNGARVCLPGTPRRADQAGLA